MKEAFTHTHTQLLFYYIHIYIHRERERERERERFGLMEGDVRKEIVVKVYVGKSIIMGSSGVWTLKKKARLETDRQTDNQTQ
jgi:hypothetical protein